MTFDSQDELFDWQQQGGTLDIPNNWFVTKANFDAKEPYIEITNEKDSYNYKTLFIPKSLAYYLRNHFCGSQSMHDQIVDYERFRIQTEIRKALGLDN